MAESWTILMLVVLLHDEFRASRGDGNWALLATCVV